MSNTNCTERDQSKILGFVWLFIIYQFNPNADAQKHYIYCVLVNSNKCKILFLNKLQDRDWIIKSRYKIICSNTVAKKL